MTWLYMHKEKLNDMKEIHINYLKKVIGLVNIRFL